jgi:hypothetical protein
MKDLTLAKAVQREGTAQAQGMEVQITTLRNAQQATTVQLVQLMPQNALLELIQTKQAFTRKNSVTDVTKDTIAKEAKIVPAESAIVATFVHMVKVQLPLLIIIALEVIIALLEPPLPPSVREELTILTHLQQQQALDLPLTVWNVLREITAKGEETAGKHLLCPTALTATTVQGLLTITLPLTELQVMYVLMVTTAQVELKQSAQQEHSKTDKVKEPARRVQWGITVPTMA